MLIFRYKLMCVARRYRDLDGFDYILSPAAESGRVMRRFSPTLSLKRALTALLDSCGYAVAEQKLRDTLSGGYEYGDLFSVAAVIARNIVQRLYASPYDETLFSACLSTMRMLSTLDFESLLAEACEAERVLLADKACAFEASDDDTRKQYRDIIIKRAKKSGLSQVGEAGKLGGEIPVTRPRGGTGYFIALTALTLLFITAALIGSGMNILIALLLALPLSEAAKFCCDRVFSRIFPAKPLYKLRPDHVPEDAATLAVTTTLLFGREKDCSLFDRLELAYLANLRYAPYSRYGMLCDLRDADSEETESDNDIIEYAKTRINALNDKYGGGFYLFVRRRVKSKSEGAYIGRDRKRGAVIALTALLAGERGDFDTVIGDQGFFGAVRYIVTLDADTRLGLCAVSDLVRTMTHPANAPIIKNGVVVSGHAILQPRMETSAESCEASYFARMNTGGVDIYANACFDLYQTLFGEGTFCGKGIFDASAFRMLITGAFEPESILSHDTLEGGYLRCAAVTELALTDGCPRSPASYFDRLHRWIRGDVQALRYAKKPLSPLSVYKLTDNIRRALVPVFSTAAIIFSALFDLRAAATAAVGAALYLALPFLLSLLKMRFFVRCRSAMSDFAVCATSLLFNITSLLHVSVITCDAIFRAVWRMKVSHIHTLQWVTASESDSLKRGGLPWYLLRYSPSLIVGALLLIAAEPVTVKAFAALWLLFPFICAISDRPIKRKAPTVYQREFVLNRARDMWRYFSELVTERENYLPPDNYQVSPSETAASRTSPTNIGLYMLSTLAARDLGLIDTAELCGRLRHTLSTVKKLEKLNGHLYNWYDSRTLRVLGTPYISTVDSGNFVVSLSVLAVGLREYADEDTRAAEISDELESIAAETNFSFLFDRKRSLFHIGFDDAAEKLSDSYYDLLMSEARTACYFCAARGMSDDPRKLWRALRRPLIKEEGFIGTASWTGTMFEYFMPSLFIPVYRGTLGYESLSTALAVQKRDGVRGVWGKSESGYYTFDADMNYQYMAFGCAKLGIRRGLARERVYSPYSSFLTLSMSPSSSIRNLLRMDRLGLYGRCGYYEAVDFTRSRVGGSYAPIRMYMSHHIGMSLIACDNFIGGGVMPMRFMRDPRNACAAELLSEKIPFHVRANRLPRDARDYGLHRIRRSARQSNAIGAYRRAAAVSNNKCVILADSDGEISLRDGRLTLTSPIEGAMGGLRLAFRADGAVYELSGRGFSYDDDHISWLYDDGEKRVSAQISLHSDYAAFGVHIEAAGDFTEFAPLLTFHPVMARISDYTAHPAFCDLSVEAEYDAGLNTLYYRRRPRLEGERGYTLGVSMLSGGVEFATRRDSALPMSYDKGDIASLAGAMRGEGELGACIIPFCALTKRSAAHGKYACDFLIAGGRDKSEVDSIIHIAARRKKRGIVADMRKSLERVINTRYAVSSLSERRIAELILTALTGKLCDRPEISPPLNALWKLGISGDLPLVALDASKAFDGDGINASDESAVREFIAAHEYLTVAGIRFDLVFIVSDGEKYGNPRAAHIKRLISDAGGESFISRRGGIFVVDADTLDNPLSDYASLFIALEGKSLSSIYESAIKPRETVTSLTEPIAKIREPFGGSVGNSFSVSGVGVDIKKGPQRLPWSYIYANRIFGTLVTQNSLGFSWFLNSREGRISPWSNDILRGCSGERIIMALNGVEYDLCAVANEVEYLHGRAVWRGSCDGVSFTVEAGVDARLPVKGVIVSVGEGSNVRLAFTPDKNSPFAPTVIEAERGAYLICAAKSEKALRYIKARFTSAAQIREMLDGFGDYVRHTLSSFKLESGNGALDRMMSFYLPYQSVFCRIFARTGFYQSGGAYGFRDQLQDMTAAMYYLPKLCRVHIIRCCARQYPEGDVMHWWHGGKNPRGVRTLCSDDMLWLPYISAKYASQTGDYLVFEVKAPYRISEPLGEGERERYEAPPLSDYSESVYSHCLRAICHVKFGSHGLPLIGSCDWNDGMSEVGRDGKGESVWLAFFYRLVLRDFKSVCESFGDTESLRRFASLDEKLSAAITRYAWEGDRYLRAFFDDGTPLGGEDCEACKIDALPQAFACIVDGGENAKIAADTAYRELFDHRHGLYKLFTPAFGENGKNPGYIKGYVKGVRENGGQYTHAAVWAAWGLYEIGENARAYELLSALNPLKKYENGEIGELYRAEPYALCGDVYSAENHEGRGGWSIYTGAAAWYFCVTLENLLGYREFGSAFTLSPRLCGEFSGFTLNISRFNTSYKIRVSEGERTEYRLDGEIVNNRFLFDESRHFLEITVAKSGGMV